MALMMTSGRHNVEVTEDRSRLLAVDRQVQGRPRGAASDAGLELAARRGAAGEFAMQEFDANMRP